ncbi:transposase [Viridibacillus sp. YIM B01967]|uniref:Transposase n=1 Tax=Viridibacillus soli TaxID=2798301 RepID=A0ABS1H6W6_9BACL|nr:transposase [Viridibacillus soli]
MKSVQEKSVSYKKRVKINFDGGHLSSDSVLLLYKEFDEKLGITKTVKEKIHVSDTASHHTHFNYNSSCKKYTNIWLAIIRTTQPMIYKLNQPCCGLLNPPFPV